MARGRARLGGGQLGADAPALAKALIENVIEGGDD